MLLLNMAPNNLIQDTNAAHIKDFKKTRIQVLLPSQTTNDMEILRLIEHIFNSIYVSVFLVE